MRSYIVLTWLLTWYLFEESNIASRAGASRRNPSKMKNQRVTSWKMLEIYLTTPHFYPPNYLKLLYIKEPFSVFYRLWFLWRC